MAESYLDNPAGRLHAVLLAIKMFQKTNYTVKLALPEILGIQPPFAAAVARGLAQLLVLPDQVRDEVLALGEEQPKDLLLEWVPNVNSAMDSLLFPTSSIGQVAAVYGDGDLAKLEFCSRVLRSVRRELTIDKGTLAGLRDQIADLLAALEADADMDASLRRLLLFHVRAVQRACEDYDLLGADGIRGAYEQMLGAFITHAPDAAPHKTSPRTWAKFKSLTIVLVAVLQLGTAGLDLVDALDSSKPAPKQFVVGAVVPAQPAPRELEAPSPESARSPGIASAGNGQSR